MKVLLYKMKHDTDWDTTIESYYPITLLKPIVKTILAQTKDQYCYATVYDQDFAWYGFHWHNLKYEQYYERFYTKVDVGEAIDITRQHRVLM